MPAAGGPTGSWRAAVASRESRQGVVPLGAGETGEHMGHSPQWLRAWGRRSTKKRVLQGFLDNLAWVLALIFAEWQRRDLDPTRINWHGLVTMLPVVFTAQALAGRASGLYRGR